MVRKWHGVPAWTLLLLAGCSTQARGAGTTSDASLPLHDGSASSQDASRDAVLADVGTAPDTAAPGTCHIDPGTDQLLGYRCQDPTKVVYIDSWFDCEQGDPSAFPCGTHCVIVETVVGSFQCPAGQECTDPSILLAEGLQWTRVDASDPRLCRALDAGRGPGDGATRD